MAELEFRDGKREVPDHLLELLRQLDTFTMTYEQAILEADKLRERQYLNTQMDRFVEGHFRVNRR